MIILLFKLFIVILLVSKAFVTIFEAKIKFIFLKLIVIVRINKQLNRVATIRVARIKKAI